MWKKILVLAWSGFVLSGCVTFPTEEQPPTRGGPPPEAFKRPSGAKVVLVVLENKNEPPALKQPFLEKLMKEGRYLAKYHGVAHPSQPNYIAMVSGSIEGVDRGDADVTLERCHIGRNLSSWIVYAEDYILTTRTPALRKTINPTCASTFLFSASLMSIARVPLTRALATRTVKRTSEGLTLKSSIALRARVAYPTLHC